MAVICATLASEMKKVEEKLSKGISIDTIINEMVEDTQNVRYDGDGYNKEWIGEAEKRGLYVNRSWADILERLSNEVKVF